VLGETAAPALFNTLTLLLPFATQTCPMPSINSDIGLTTPAGEPPLTVTAVPDLVYSCTALVALLTVQISPALSNATAP
jgi:hypothetical protein